MTSEQEAWWVQAAAGTRPLQHGALLVAGCVVLASGALTELAAATAGVLLPYLLLLLVVAALLGSLPDLGLLRLAATMARLGVRRAGGRPPTSGPAPGRQLTLATDRGQEEVVLAAARRIPAGTDIVVLGPRWFGCRHAWLVRYGSGRLVVARGIMPCLATVLVVGVLSASWVAR